METRQMQYHVLKNLDINFRMSRDYVLYDEYGNELERQHILPYCQITMDESDVEDMLENANAVADKVTVYLKHTTTTHPIENINDISGARQIIQNAVAILIDYYTDQSFHDEYIKVMSPNVSRFEYFETTATEETRVFLMFKHNLLSSEVLMPARPGAVVNEYEVITK